MTLQEQFEKETGIRLKPATGSGLLWQTFSEWLIKRQQWISVKNELPYVGLLAKVKDGELEKVLEIAECTIIIKDWQGNEYVNTTNGRQDIICISEHGKIQYGSDNNNIMRFKD